MKIRKTTPPSSEPFLYNMKDRLEFVANNPGIWWCIGQYSDTRVCVNKASQLNSGELVQRDDLERFTIVADENELKAIYQPEGTQ